MLKSRFSFKGKTVFVRTFRYFYIGIVEKITFSTIYLSNVVLVLRAGKTEDFMKYGADKAVKYEVYPPEQLTMIYRVGNEISEWNHEIPKTSK